MSTDKSDTISEAGASDMVCANCGKAEIDDVKLKDCDKCDLARYCGNECREDDRKTHEATCKERAAELRDELLFRQPESSHLGDCPICFLPLPLNCKVNLQPCCCKLICLGCLFAMAIRELEHGIEFKCPFCREQDAKGDERAEANDPAALRKVGARHYDEGDYAIALEYYSRAAELGNAMAHFDLSRLYRDGKGVEKDEEREIYHLEEAAIAGHPFARFRLGLVEFLNYRRDRAVKHFIIASTLGCDNSIKHLKVCYKMGHVSKDDFAVALRAHQAAVDATKSPQREAAEVLG